MEANNVIVDKKTAKTIDDNLKPVSPLHEVFPKREVSKENIETDHEHDMSQNHQEKIVEVV